MFLLSHSEVPAPSELVGITSISTHSFRARDRVARLQRSLHSNVKVTMYCGDVVYRPQAVQHPLEPLPSNYYDTILALDCAYHFQTRRDFLRQCFDRLVPGGRIALADICFDSAAMQKLSTKLFITTIRAMPRQNALSKEQYVADMLSMGYVDVKMEDISEDVFPGFVRLLKGKGWTWWVFGNVISLLASCGARFVVVSASK